MKITHALIDIGSTLIDGPPIGPARWLIEKLALDVRYTKDLSALIFTQGFLDSKDLADRLSHRFGTDPELARFEVERFWTAQRENAYLIEGALDTLDRLIDAGIQIAYISNIWQPFYQGFLRCVPKHYSQAPSFLSFKTGFQKPDIEFYRHALHCLACIPDQTLMIGDTFENDIVPAQKLGLKTVWVLQRPEKEKDDIVKAINGEHRRPDLTLATIKDLKQEHIKALIEI